MRHTTEQHDPIAQLYRGLDTEDTASAVSVILKLRGDTCDIDCLYCYEKRKEAPGGARIDAGHHLQIANGWGKPPSFVYKLDWDLLATGESRLDGALTVRSSWYKVAGDMTATGTVSATRVAAVN